jgi:hypothetical protein
MLKRFIYPAFFLLTMLLVTSCEDVIDVDLKTSPNQIVIEGNITDENIAQTVKISQSVPYTDNNTYPPVAGAKVVVTDNAGHTFPFTETQPGIYTSKTLKGQYGHTYNLSVVANSTTYTAASTMPNPVLIDSLSIKVITFGGDDRKIVQVHYKDPVDVVNQYRFVMDVNGIITKRIYANNDRLTNGNSVTELLFYQTDEDNKELVKGDKVQVQIQCIDKDIFTYWNTLMQQTQNGPGGGVTPGNPPSNISNNALGYFSAHTLSKKTLVVNSD